MNLISSADNKLFKHIVKLGAKKQRDLSSEYLIEGINILREALSHNVDICYVMINQEIYKNKLNSEISQLLEQLTSQGIKISIIEEKLFNQLVKTETPQGLLAVVKKREWLPEEQDKQGNLIVLDRLQDPGNIGTVLRTADGAGYGGALILKGTADIYGPKVVRATTGSLFRLPIAFSAGPEEALELLGKLGKTIICADINGTQNYFDCDMKDNIALIIGNEGNGICDILLEGCHKKVKIPMKSDLESLNVGVAAGILIYEAVRE